MPRRIASPRFPSYPATEREVKEMLGLPRKLGPEAVPSAVLQGVQVWVVAAPAPRYRADGRLVKGSAHRVMCACPGCGKTVSVGRLAQHRC